MGIYGDFDDNREAFVQMSEDVMAPKE